MTVLLRKEQGFLLHRQTGVDLAEDRAVLAAVEEDAALDGVQTVHYIVPAVAEADLRLVNDVLVEVSGDQFHPLALYALSLIHISQNIVAANWRCAILVYQLIVQ